MLADIVADEAFLFLFASFRLIPLILVAPVLGDATIPNRFKIALAILIAIVLTGPLQGRVPDIPDTPLQLVWLFTFEFLIGLMIGITARLLMSAAHVAGTVIAFQTGLAAAQNFNPDLGGQTALVSTFMTVLTVTLLVVTDVHHLMIFGVLNSYDMFPSGEPLPIGDFAAVVTYFVSQSFRLGVQLSAPFLAYAIIYNVGLGLMARLAPRIQVFFVALPLNVYLGFALFMVLIPSILWMFLDHFQRLYVQFLPS